VNVVEQTRRVQTEGIFETVDVREFPNLRLPVVPANGGAGETTGDDHRPQDRHNPRVFDTQPGENERGETQRRDLERLPRLPARLKVVEPLDVER
jgi:hypothetical protein